MVMIGSVKKKYSPKLAENVINTWLSIERLSGAKKQIVRSHFTWLR